jgi:hypothetical protein
MKEGRIKKRAAGQLYKDRRRTSQRLGLEVVRIAPRCMIDKLRTG